MFLYKPVEKTKEAQKLVCPFHGPYRITELGTNTATIARVDRPEGERDTTVFSGGVRPHILASEQLRIDAWQEG